LMVGVVNTLRARGQRFDSFIGDAPLIGAGGARSPICRDVGETPAPSTSETR